jgi:Dynein light intermediate chain (DLIC)
VCWRSRFFSPKKRKKVSITSTASNFLLFSRCVTPRRSCCFIYLPHHLAAQAEVIFIISHRDVCFGEKELFARSIVQGWKLSICGWKKKEKNLQKDPAVQKNRFPKQRALLLAACDDERVLSATNLVCLRFRSEILGEVQTQGTTKLPSNKSVLVLGDNSSGKTSLIAKLQGVEDPKKGSGLEYAYIDVRDEYRDGELHSA